MTDGNVLPQQHELVMNQLMKKGHKSLFLSSPPFSCEQEHCHDKCMHLCVTDKHREMHSVGGQGGFLL